MMRIALLSFLTFCYVGASAQWISFKKRERLPLLPAAAHCTVKLQAKANLLRGRITTITTPRTDYNLELFESSVMKTAQHNMRFRVYDVASYNFSDLATLYVQQRRLSEAKWFYLQSCNISRQQNNDKLTISNLINLASIKSDIGDFILAQQDLIEARDMAASHGWLINLIQVEQKLKFIQNKRITSAPTDLRYASNVTLSSSVVD